MVKIDDPRIDVPFASEIRDAFQIALLDWFRNNARPLPWRMQPTIYKTVVSEFMLQQTQVKTMLPYFERWMGVFPDFDALANASTERLMAAWSGLGYYARAHYLQKVAQRFIHNPARTYQEWLRYPGVGSYTAAAIASIAYCEAVAAVDGNVVRVLTRVFNQSLAFASKAAAIQWCRPYAQLLLSVEHPGDFNEALMECGAIICTPAHPQCVRCPLQMFCRAFHENTADQCPRFVPAKHSRAIINRLWIMLDEALLLEPSAGRRTGVLWELPVMTPERKALLSPLTMLFRGKRSIGLTDYTENIYQPKHAIAKSALPVSLFPMARFFRLNELQSCAISGPHRRWIQECMQEKNV